MKKYVKLVLIVLLCFSFCEVYADSGNGTRVQTPSSITKKNSSKTSSIKYTANKKTTTPSRIVTTPKICEDPKAAKKTSSKKYYAPNLYWKYGDVGGTYSTRIYTCTSNLSIIETRLHQKQ